MVRAITVQEQPATPTEGELSCRHHWIIESPNGATSWGQCKICGARKEFPNSAGDFVWERDSGGSSNRWGSTVELRSNEGGEGVSLVGGRMAGEGEGF